ncbi:FxsA family protein [Halomonas halocynthiae]|uniref:FxsA family protein n=1 Tax=Halomonas halocynthiae TaxID=176290 RepID=UPI000413B559|nr:FxsA family protein [Halomonas halocynthiae]
MPLVIFISIFTLLDFILLFSIGSHIGLLLTLILVISTGMLGLHLIRREGIMTFARARQRLERGEMPAEELLSGAALVFGGALLMAPGFLSDALGFMCLIPDGRRLLGKALSRLGMSLRSVTATYTHSGPQQTEGWHPSDDSGWHTANKQNHQGAPLEGEFIARGERRS